MHRLIFMERLLIQDGEITRKEHRVTAKLKSTYFAYFGGFPSPEAGDDHAISIAKYLDEIKTKTPNPVPPAARAAQDLEEYV
ncbi:MAG: hypothetical protein AAF327_09705 [Cyanobacteria bacterium P01_A01_bin.37]